jgi:hypothetical protein
MLHYRISCKRDAETCNTTNMQWFPHKWNFLVTNHPLPSKGALFLFKIFSSPPSLLVQKGQQPPPPQQFFQNTNLYIQTLRPWGWRQNVPLNRWQHCPHPHDVNTQKLNFHQHFPDYLPFFTFPQIWQPAIYICKPTIHNIIVLNASTCALLVTIC